MTEYSEQCVSDVVGDTYLDWEEKQKIVISTPTGSGKTLFIFKKLLPCAVKNDVGIVYFCNRKTLFEQVTKNQHDKLTIFTYQFAETCGSERALDKAKAKAKSRIKYIVFDEAHYFLHDATFNSRTDTWRTFLSYHRSDFVFIFLTATPEELLLFLNGSHSAQGLYKRFADNNCMADIAMEIKNLVSNTSNIIYYSYRPSYNYIDVKYFRPSKKDDCPDKQIPTKYDNIIPIIKRSEDQWLVFVSNKHEGERLSYKLNMEKNDLAFSQFVDSNAKQRKNSPLKELVERDTFSCKVLIATSVIDNGINIEKPEVKNIVISAIDKTTFLQMLGRLRVKDRSLFAKKITLYIMSHSLKELNCILQHNIRALQLLGDFELMRETSNNIMSWRLEKELLRISDNPRSGFNQLFKKVVGNDLENTTINKTALLRNFAVYRNGAYKMLYDSVNLDVAINEMKENGDRPVDREIAFLRRQLTWMDKSYDDTAWVVDERALQARAKLITMLQNQCDAGYITSKEEHSAFIISCLTLLNDAEMLRPKYKNDLSRYKDGRTTPGRHRLNSALSEASIPYTMKSHQKMKNGDRSTYWKIVERSCDDK